MKEPDRCYNQFIRKAKEAQIHMEESNFEMNVQMDTNLVFPQAEGLSLHWKKVIPCLWTKLFCTNISHLLFTEL